MKKLLCWIGIHDLGTGYRIFSKGKWRTVFICRRCRKER